MVRQKFINRSLDSGSRHVSFKTTAFTAIAESSGWIYRSMTEFTCNTMMAVEQNTTAYKTASEACTQGDDHKVFHLTGVSINHFTHCRCVGIVSENTGHTVPFRECFCQW